MISAADAAHWHRDDYRVAEAAELLGVSDDTMRRWVDAGRLAPATSGGGRTMVDGADLARSPRSWPTTPTGNGPAPAPSAPATG